MDTNKPKDHEFCLRCGKKLKSPENRLRGMGLVCWKKSQVKKICRLFNP